MIQLSVVLGLAAAGLTLVATGLALVRGLAVEATLAWLLTFVAFPGIGPLVYLLLSSPGVGHTTRRKRLRAAAVRDETVDPAGRGRVGPDGAGDRDVLALCRLVTEITGIPPSGHNRVSLLVEDDASFRRIEDALHDAKRSIWAEYYLIRSDETGYRFLDVLARKAREGIEVRLLYDAVGSYQIDPGRLDDLVRAGGQVEAFLPVNPLRRRWAVHLRNHRKLIIVDGTTGFTGGMNVGDEYSGRARRKGRAHYRDSHLALTGPAVADLELIFAEDWSFATGRVLEVPSGPEPSDPGPPLAVGSGDGLAVVAVVPSGPDQEFNAHAMLYFAGIASARRRVLLSCPYFVPDSSTVRALVSSALRGVDVRVMVPRDCDVWLVGPAARFTYEALVRGGVRVFEYRPSMLHAKTMAVDSTWAIVGSANVDFRSFRLNFELGALVHEESLVRQLEDRFEGDQNDSHEITAAELTRRSLPERLAYGTARLLAPVL